MWKVVTNSNLNSPLKLFFFSPILTNNNLLLKIYCENIVVKFLNQDFLSLYYFLFFHFILLHTRVPYLPSFISFSPPEPSSNIICSSHQRKERERERQRERRKTGGSAFTMPLEIEVHHALPRPTSHHGSSSSPPSGWVRSTCSFLFFSYLLVLIQLYFKKWILFCVWVM